MKIKFLTALALTITLVLSSTVAIASGGSTLWQVGKPDGNVNPIDGSLEYPANHLFYNVFDYPIGSDSDPINAPSMPGYIGPANVCEFASGRPCTDTAAVLNIDFSTACYYDAGDLTLVYDRYGSESDNLYFDGVWFATISATEGGFRQFSLPLSAAGVGGHTLKIEYAGGGAGNGHYIDYLKLTSSVQCPIPIAVDIKPGSYPSCFNNDGNGVIPVAILGSADFDVYDVDVATVSLEGMQVAARGKANKLLASYEDVNSDGFTDLVVKIEDVDGKFTAGTGTATVTGNLLDGSAIEGVGDICITQ